jgi:hypothetical protein
MKAGEPIGCLPMRYLSGSCLCGSCHQNGSHARPARPPVLTKSDGLSGIRAILPNMSGCDAGSRAIASTRILFITVALTSLQLPVGSTGFVHCHRVPNVLPGRRFITFLVPDQPVRSLAQALRTELVGPELAIVKAHAEASGAVHYQPWNQARSGRELLGVPQYSMPSPECSSLLVRRRERHPGETNAQ